MDESSQKILGGAIISYASFAINVMLGLVYIPWMIRSIGIGDYGLYTLAISIISFFALDFGLSEAVSRFVSKYHAQGDAIGVNNVLGVIYRLYLITVGIFGLALALAFFFIDDVYLKLSPSELEVFKGLYIVAALYSLVYFPFIPINGILISYEKFVALKLCDLGQRLVAVGLVMVALHLGYDVFALVTANAVAGLGAMMAKLWLLRGLRIKINVRFRNRALLIEVLRFAAGVSIIAISQRFIFNIAPSILGVTSGSEAIAIFGTASVLEGYVWTATSVIGGLLLPKVSRLVVSQRSELIFELLVKVGRVQLFVVVLLFAGFIAVGFDFVQLWVGDAFRGVYLCVIVLVLPSVVGTTMQVADVALVAVGKLRGKSVAYAITAMVSVGLMIPLSHYWGALGASLAISMAFLVRTTVMCLVFHNELRLDMWSFFERTLISILPSLLAVLLFAGVLWLYFPVFGWIELAVKGGTFIAGYAAILWMFALKREEKQALWRFVQKVRSR